jgi:hypothetical protein
MCASLAYSRCILLLTYVVACELWSFLVLFNFTFSNRTGVEWEGEFELMWVEGVVAYYKVLSQHLRGGAEVKCR